MEESDRLMETQDKRLEKSPAGYLVASSEKDHAAPQGFVSRAERQRRQGATQAKQRHAAEERHRQQQEAARAKAEQEDIDAYRKALTPEQRARLEADALAQAGEDRRRSLNEPGMAPPARHCCIASPTRISGGSCNSRPNRHRSALPRQCRLSDVSRHPRFGNSPTRSLASRGHFRPIVPHP